MQSSTAIAIRALVMLIVLISVPLFAIFGKTLPDVVKGLLEGRTLVLGPAPGTPSNQQITGPLPAPNNPFGQVAPYRAGADAGLQGTSAASLPGAASVNPGGVSGGAVSGNGPAGSPTAVPNGNSLKNGMSTSVAGNSVSAPNVALIGDMPKTAVSAVPNSAMSNEWLNPPPTAGTAQPASFQTATTDLSTAQAAVPSTANLQASEARSAAPSGLVPTTSGEMTPSKLTPAADEKFRRTEMRLRELGATHYMLETWGPDNNRYRFVCKMAIGANPNANRYFQAIENEPWQAMDAVLRQVEEWRSQSQQ